VSRAAYTLGARAQSRAVEEGQDMASKDTSGHQRVSRKSDQADEAAPEAAEAADVQERHEKLSDDVDSILDEIDEVLEENAEEFVRGFVQKGGQ